jgi:hypothetical protein
MRWMIPIAAISVGLRGFASSSICAMTRHVQIAKLTALNLGGDLCGIRGCAGVGDILFNRVGSCRGPRGQQCSLCGRESPCV